MGEHPHIVFWELKVGAIDLSITNEILLIWAAGAATFLTFLLAARKLSASATSTSRFTMLIESAIDFVRMEVAEAFLGHHAKRWFPFVAALFFFVLFANLIGKIPVPWFIVTPTGNINVTAALAIFVFIVAQVVGLAKMGPLAYCKRKFLLPGAPLWVQPLAIIIMPIVLLAEPFSLAVRLFANMTAGHQIIAVISGFGLMFAASKHLWVKPLAALPFGFVVVMLAFELFVAIIQAFIFALLSALYLSESLEDHH
jgi:F-type H+-transporting ATPase subunit a